MGVVGRLDGYQRRHRWLGLPLATVYKFIDDQGNHLAALVTYYGFLSLFPLLMLLVTFLEFLLGNDLGLQRWVLRSAVNQFPVIGEHITQDIRSPRGNGLAVTVGILVSLYGSMGVAQAAQNAMNRIWGVARNDRPNPFLSRLRSLLLLVVIGGGVLFTTLVSGVVTRVPGYGLLVHTLATVLAVGLNSVLFTVALRMLTVRPLTVREVLGGAFGAAVTWQLLQWAGGYYLTHLLRGASATYGVFALVLGLIAWIYLGALTLILAAELNAVRVERMWPRSLLTPVTDNVRLTRGDRKAYASYAGTEQHKGFQTIEVGFHQEPRPDQGDDPPT
ncbi:YihY/virulence factor BrkB family protein [Actinomadura scrupuli]|uniref:YihY/virulence factor BrkB family protein n=1 Tax=Actinomadura scrupuli TaxID=559629 RepID=UPI003D9591C6